MHREVTLKEYLGREASPKPTAHPYSTVRISVFRGGVLEICFGVHHQIKQSHCDLLFDELTFDIYLRFHPEGTMKVLYQDERKMVQLVGFMKEFGLSAEELLGSYHVDWIEPWTLCKVIYHSRHNSDYVYKPKKKLTIVLPEEDFKMWQKAAGNQPMTVFVRSAVQRYLDDYKPEWGRRVYS